MHSASATEVQNLASRCANRIWSCCWRRSDAQGFPLLERLVRTGGWLGPSCRQWLYSLGRCKYMHNIDHSAQVLAMLNNCSDELGRHSGLGGGGKRPPGVCRYHSLLQKGLMCPPPTLSLPFLHPPIPCRLGGCCACVARIKLQLCLFSFARLPYAPVGAVPGHRY